MAGQSPGFNHQFSHDGQPCVDFKLYAFVSGTNTPKGTFQDIDEVSAHEHPIILDEQGRIPVGFFLEETGSYDFTLLDPDDAPIHEWTNVSAIPPAADATFLPLAGDVAMEGLFELAGPAEAELQPPTLGQMEDAIAAAVAAAVVTLTAGQEPVGSIRAWVTTTVPDRYLAVNGQAVSREDFPALFTLWGTTFGVGDGTTTFNVPAWQGMFLRGYDPTEDVDPEGSGRDFTTVQDDVFKAHVHTVQATPNGSGSGGSGPFVEGVTTVNTGSTGDADETRPVNMPTMWIVRALL
jgi:microcystin-dependent protein